MTYSAQDFPPGSQDRIDVAMMSAGAACNADDVITDWGDFDEDHTEAEQANSWEHTDVDVPIEVEFTAVNALNDTFYNQS